MRDKRLWLTRQRDGNYMLTAFKPVVATVAGTGQQDAYMRLGEPIGVRGLCTEGIRSFIGRELPPMEPTRVRVSIDQEQTEDGSAT